MGLRQNRLTSLEVYRAATEADLATLDGHRAPIARLVQAGDPAVLDALFGPVEWTGVEYGLPLGGRGLTIHWTVGHAAPAEFTPMWRW